MRTIWHPTLSPFLSSLSPPSFIRSKRSLTVVFLLLAIILSPCLLDQVQAVDMQADAHRPVVDEQRGLDKVGLGLNKLPERKTSKFQDSPHFDAGNDDQGIKKKINKVHGDDPALDDAVNAVPMAQTQQKLEDQKKVVEKVQRNEFVESEDKKMGIKQQMEERARVLNENLKQFGQHQVKNEPQNMMETQKEHQREQHWLAEVQRKSQEVLAERQLRQKQQEQVPQVHQADGQVPEDHDKPDLAVRVKDEQVSLKPNPSQTNNAYLADNDISKQDDRNNRNIDNKLSAYIVDDSVNNTRHPRPQGVLASVDERGSLQHVNKKNNEMKASPMEDKPHFTENRINNGESDQKLGPPAVGSQDTFGQTLTRKKESDNANINPVLGSPVAVNAQNISVNVRSGNVQPNPPAAFGGQWSKYEFNNAQQANGAQQANSAQQANGAQRVGNDQQQQLQIGGINLSWDWEDFSVMFNSYGSAEMKVRRSPHPTTGEPWPMPQYYSKRDDKVYRLSKELHFVPTGVICDILEEGLTRHLQRTLRGCVEDMYDNLQNAEGSPIEDPTLRYERDEFLKAPVITRVEVKVRKPCDKYPSLESDETYDLIVKKKKTYIWANEVWGALRGLETFGHLVWRGTDGFLYIKETVISDYPRFPHRGLHIDTSRHFLFKEVILDILDSMEMNKLNVFHWHIVDDQSFPYESKVYPELSRKGAFHPTYVYTLEDIAEIIEYARLRGIRVMPEFDTPGHTYAWGLSRPELLTQCYSGSMPVKGYLGPIDPSKNSTYRFLQTLFKEIVEVFKDQYLHLGGDEVPLGCWQSNPEVSAFAQELAKRPHEPRQSSNVDIGGSWSMWSDDIRRVYEYYENRLISIVNELGQKRKKGIKYVMWQEVMNNNLQLPNDTIIQVWMGDMADVMRATSMGYQVIYSTCWYMDHIEYGTKWPKYYNCDPVDQSYGFHIDEKKVLGGEAAFWAEYFSNENLIPLMWPRASAAAERLWSSKEVKNLDKAAERLSEHRCRMIKRGINAGEINGPGYCLHAPPKRRLYNDTAGCKGGNCSRTHNFVQIEDFEVHLSQRGGGLADCGHVFTQGNGNVFIILTLALVVVFALYAVSRSSSHFHRMKICRNRSALIVFVGVLLVYILCYTTIWMRAFEFSGSFHKTLQEDSRSGSNGNDDNFRPISS